MENESDWKETLRLCIGEGIAFLVITSILIDVSWIGVEGYDGNFGVPGRLLSADIALFGVDTCGVVAVLVVFGEGQRLGVGDLYLELTSLVFKFGHIGLSSSII